MDKHDVYALLLDMGVLEYGGVISSTNFRKLCGIDEVITGTKKEFDCQSLQESEDLDLWSRLEKMKARKKQNSLPFLQAKVSKR